MSKVIFILGHDNILYVLDNIAVFWTKIWRINNLSDMC